MLTNLKMPGQGVLFQVHAYYTPHQTILLNLNSGLNLQSLNLMQNLTVKIPDWEKKRVDMPEEFYMTFQQICQKNGFQVDQYNVTTQDKYVLGNFRIRTPGLKPGAPVVFLQHGLFDSSDTWIITDAKVAPAFQLARAGYDVYLGNNRGNFYSNKNLVLDPETQSKQFHDYSFIEYGKYDLTSQIEEALKISGRQNLTYVGHSQGTTQMFYELSQNQAWINERVNLFVALAPIANMQNSSGLNTIVKLLDTIWKTLNVAGVFEVCATKYKQDFVNTVSSSLFDWDDVLSKILDAVNSSPNSNPKADKIRWNRFPNETSVKSIIHLGKLVLHGFVEMNDKPCFIFCESPKKLQLNEVTTPVMLINGADDGLADTKDVDWLQTQLKNVVYRQVIPNARHGLNHLNDMSYFQNVLSYVHQYNPVDQNSLQNLYLY